MGLLGSKKKTVVDTLVMRVVEDEQLPNTLKDSVIRSVLGNYDLADTLLGDVINSSAMRFEHLYHYAREHYHYGLPDIHVNKLQDEKFLVQSVLSEQENQPIELDYYWFGALNNTHLGWQLLSEAYAYDHRTNEIHRLSQEYGQPVYLVTLVPLYPQEVLDQADPGMLQPIGPKTRAGYTPERPAQRGVYNLGLGALQESSPPEAYTEEAVRIEYVYWGADRKLHYGSRIESLEQWDHELDYFQVGYRITDAQGFTQHKHWTYAYGTGEYPDLDRIFDPPVTQGTFFPIVEFRDNKTNLTAPHYEGTPAYESSTQLLRFLDMDFATLGESIHDNPDIGDVEQAIMTWGVPLTSQDPAEMQYLYRFFERVHQEAPYSDSFLKRYPLLGMGSTALTIKDAGYEMGIHFAGVSKTTKAGRIGDKGSYSNHFESYEHFQEREGQRFRHRMDIQVRVLRYQRSEQVYEELRIYSPTEYYRIDHKRYVHVEANDERFLVPLDKSLTDPLPFHIRETLYFRSMHFVFNCKVVQKLKWYETGIFKTLLVVAAIVITVISLGKTTAALIAAWEAGVTAFAITVLKTLVITFAVQTGFQILVRELGLENTFIAAVIATAAAMYLGVNHGSIKGAPWAEELLMLSSNLSRGIDQEARRLISEYNAERQEFQLLAQEATEELEEIRKALDPDIGIDPFAFIGLEPIYIPGETADIFYQRTVDSGNIGVMSLEAIDHYVDNALELPSIEDTLGETFYG